MSKYRGIAQLVEQRSPKPRAEGSNPSAPATCLIQRKLFNILSGPVVQLVRTPACHAGGRRFEPVLGRHFQEKAIAFLNRCGESREYAAIAQSVERILGKDEVTSSNLVSSSTKNPVTAMVAGFLVCCAMIAV